MNFHAIVKLNEKAEVRVAPTGGAERDRQVVLEYFPGDSPATYTSLTFFCPDDASAVALVAALKSCKPVKHTPGPWKVGPINYADVYGSDGNLVSLIPKGFECTVGDAQLIAAAPTMLKALRSLRAGIEDGTPQSELHSIADSAIAMATGQVDRQDASSGAAVDEQHKKESR